MPSSIDQAIRIYTIAVRQEMACQITPRELLAAYETLAAAYAAQEKELALAIAHDRQPYPTAHAYETVCRMRDKLRDEIDLLKPIVDVAEMMIKQDLGIDELKDAVKAYRFWSSSHTSKRDGDHCPMIEQEMERYLEMLARTLPGESFTLRETIEGIRDAAEKTLTASTEYDADLWWQTLRAYALVLYHDWDGAGNPVPPSEPCDLCGAYAHPASQRPPV